MRKTINATEYKIWKINNNNNKRQYQSVFFVYTVFRRYPSVEWNIKSDYYFNNKQAHHLIKTYTGFWLSIKLQSSLNITWRVTFNRQNINTMKTIPRIL